VLDKRKAFAYTWLEGKIMNIRTPGTPAKDEESDQELMNRIQASRKLK
jgi:hypothetical protein